MIFRTPQSLKNRLDILEKRIGKDNMTLECHPACYQYKGYEYNEGNWKNGYTDSITLYYEDFDMNKTIRSIYEITETDMRKPTKDDYEYGVSKDLLAITWNKDYPTIIDVVDYDPGRF